MALPHIPQSNTQRGIVSFENWLSIMRSQGIVNPQYFERIIKRSGMGDTLFAMLDLVGQTIPIKDEILNVVEEGSNINVVETASDIAAGIVNGENIVVPIGNYDTDTGEDPVGVGDGIVIPSQYTSSGNDEVYVVDSITGHNATCRALNGSAYVDTLIPAGTILKIHGYFTARGTGMPAGIKKRFYKRTYRTHIVKTSLVEEGGIGAIEIIPVAGGKFITIKNQAFAELIHNKKIDDIILLSPENTNNLTLQSRSQLTNPVLSTKGLWNWAVEAGDFYGYTGATGFGIDQIADLKDYLRANDITTTEVVLLCGGGLNKYIEDSGLTFLQNYDGGSSLLAANKLGIDIKYVQRNGVILGIKEIHSFNSASGLGGSAYDFYNRGIVIPQEDIKVRMGNESTTLSNLMLGYLNNNGVDRSRVVRVIDGVTGRESVSAHEYDESALYILSEFAVIVLAPNKLIRIEKTA